MSAADFDDNDTLEQQQLIQQEEEEDIYVAGKEECGNYELDNKESQPYRAADPPEDPPDDNHWGTSVYYCDNEPELAHPVETTNKEITPFQEYEEANNNRVIEDHTGDIHDPEAYNSGDGNALEAEPEITAEPSDSFNCAEAGIGELIDASALEGFGHGFADFDHGTVGKAAAALVDGGFLEAETVSNRTASDTACNILSAIIGGRSDPIKECDAMNVD